MFIVQIGGSIHGFVIITTLLTIIVNAFGYYLWSVIKSAYNQIKKNNQTNQRNQRNHQNSIPLVNQHPWTALDSHGPSTFNTQEQIPLSERNHHYTIDENPPAYHDLYISDQKPPAYDDVMAV